MIPHVFGHFDGLLGEACRVDDERQYHGIRLVRGFVMSKLKAEHTDTNAFPHPLLIGLSKTQLSARFRPFVE
jgi:hypothetical protein